MSLPSMFNLFYIRYSSFIKSLWHAAVIVLVLTAASCKKKQNINPPNLVARDPALIEYKGKYYLFGTGTGISQWSSADLKTWQQEPSIFKAPPAWTVALFPGFDNDIWAPDIAYYKNQFYLFYSISQYASNNSAIGYATNTTLDSKDSLYKWVDHGMLINSSGTSYNAIDPNFTTDYAGNPYLTYGSFYKGITITRFKNDSLHLNTLNANVQPVLASRSAATIAATINDIEAPFILKYNNYYYMFASVGSCCDGVNSTYRTIVGRSATIDGTYTDRFDTPMADGGGEIILQGDKFWHGAGGQSVYNLGGIYYIIYFSYDDAGINRLRIARLNWDGDWPVAQAIY
jgi:arabinan endo-1,5-alpha-L-arabinosidase